MKNKLTLLFPLLLSIVFIGCNEAVHQAPVVVQDPLKDSVALNSQNGYFNQASGSYINLYGVMQMIHSTPTDTGSVLVACDSVATGTNYHLDMHLSNIKANAGKFDVRVNCKLNLLPPHDSTCMFVAQCKNGTSISFDTINVKKDDRNFTIHVKNADAGFYYIVLWGLSANPASTVAFQDVLVTAAK